MSSDRRNVGIIAGLTHDKEDLKTDPELRQSYSVWFFETTSTPRGEGTNDNPEHMSIQIVSPEEIGLDQFKDYGDGNCHWVYEDVYQDICKAIAKLNT